MQIFSTRESVKERQITLLALIETGASAGLYLVIAGYFKTYTHLAIAIVCAPFFLLRTEYSLHLALTWWDQIWERRSRTGSNFHAFLQVLASPALAMLGLLIRTYATAVGVIRHPVLSIQSMPQNWFQQTLCIDLARPPEVVPGESESKAPRPSMVSSIRILRAFPQIYRSSKTIAIVGSIIILLYLIVAYLPSTLFCVSFKATSIAYLPFIWVVQSSLGKEIGLKFRLRRIKDGVAEGYRRIFSGSVLAIFLVYLALIENLVEQEDLVNTIGSASLMKTILVASPGWQAGVVADAVLTFFLYVIADHFLSRIEGGVPVNNAVASAIIQGTVFLRGLIAIFAIGYVLSHAGLVVAQWLLPPT